MIGQLRRRRVHVLMFGAAFSCVLSALCAGAGCGHQPQTQLRIGINAWPGYELIYLAQERGYFAAEGLEVKLIEFGSLSDARRAYETGKIDGLATTVVEVLMARDAVDRDLRVVRLFNFSDGADVIVAAPGVADARQLRGKKVGVELASLGIYVLSRALELNDLTLDDVVPLAKDQRTMSEELASGQLDAVVTYPPESASMLAKPGFHIVFSTKGIPGEVVDVLALDGSITRENPERVRALNRAVDRAYEFLKSHPTEACRIMGEREGRTGEEFRQLLSDGITLVSPVEQKSYFGEHGKLHPVVDHVARSLRKVKLISSRPEVADCLATHD